MRNKLILVFGIVLFGLGCKKDLNESTATLLVGKWRWVNTEIGQNNLTPSSQGKDYFIEINKSGSVSFYENSTLLSKRRLYFYGKQTGYNGNTMFDFRISKKGKVVFSGTIKGPQRDTMYCYHFPYDNGGHLKGVIAGNFLIKEK